MCVCMRACVYSANVTAMPTFTVILMERYKIKMGSNRSSAGS